MKKTQALFLTIIVFVFISCTSTFPGMATSNPIGQKVGKASVTYIMGFPMGAVDLSVKKAAEQGSITKISTVDYEMNMIFLWFVYSKTTIVTGD